MESREIESRVQEIKDLVDELSEELRHAGERCNITLSVSRRELWIDPSGLDETQLSFWLG
jgi:predicted Co/Zn/Cd cation transporter (cation efflux family)